MPSDTLIIFGTTYTDVAGFKATDSQSATLTYIRPNGTFQATDNGTYDVSSYASCEVAIPSAQGVSF